MKVLNTQQVRQYINVATGRDSSEVYNYQRREKFSTQTSPQFVKYSLAYMQPSLKILQMNNINANKQIINKINSSSPVQIRHASFHVVSKQTPQRVKIGEGALKNQKLSYFQNSQKYANPELKSKIFMTDYKTQKSKLHQHKITDQKQKYINMRRSQSSIINRSSNPKQRELDSKQQIRTEQNSFYSVDKVMESLQQERKKEIDLNKQQVLLANAIYEAFNEQQNANHKMSLSDIVFHNKSRQRAILTNLLHNYAQYDPELIRLDNIFYQTPIPLPQISTEMLRQVAELKENLRKCLTQSHIRAHIAPTPLHAFLNLHNMYYSQHLAEPDKSVNCQFGNSIKSFTILNEGPREFSSFNTDKQLMQQNFAECKRQKFILKSNHMQQQNQQIEIKQASSLHNDNLNANLNVKQLSSRRKNLNLLVNKFQHKGEMSKEHQNVFLRVKIGDSEFGYLKQLFDANPKLTSNEMVDPMNRNAMHWAIKRGHSLIAKLLYAHNPALLEQKDIRGRLPLDIALEEKNFDMVHLIKNFVENKQALFERNTRLVRMIKQNTKIFNNHFQHF